MFFYFTLVAYATVIGGMLAQLLLGAAQLALAGVLSKWYYHLLDENQKKLVINYWKTAVLSLAPAIAAVVCINFTT